MTVESEVDLGSTFTVIIPCTIVSSPLDRPGPPRQDPASGTHRRAAILIAEDNEINRELVNQMLSRLGHDSNTVGNGREALTAAQRSLFDLILMDIQMPEMDGVAAAKAIRALPGAHGRIPIIALTANAMVGDRERYLAEGFDDYLAKPLHLHALQGIVARWTEHPASPANGAEPVAPLDHRHLAAVKQVMPDGDFAGLIESLPREIDALVDRTQYAIRANDADGVRMAMRALHDSAREFGLRELAALSDRLAADTVDLAQIVEHTGAIQTAVARAKSALETFHAPRRDSSE